MKRIYRGALATVAFGSLALAGTARAQSSAVGSGTPLDAWQEGTVQSVDSAKGALTFGDNESAETNSRTTITRNGDPATLVDIKAGDDVRAAFLPNDPFHAVRVEVTSVREQSSSAETQPGASGHLPAWYYGEGVTSPSAAHDSVGSLQPRSDLDPHPATYPGWYESSN